MRQYSVAVLGLALGRRVRRGGSRLGRTRRGLLRRVVHELGPGNEPATHVLLNDLATLNLPLDLTSLGALAKLSLADLFGIAPAVLHVLERQLLLLGQLLLAVFLGEGGTEGKAGHLEFLETLLVTGDGGLVVGLASDVELLLEVFALGTRKFGLQGVLTLELVRELLLGPRTLDEAVDVIDLVDKGLFVWEGDTLGKTDLFVTVVLGLLRV